MNPTANKLAKSVSFCEEHQAEETSTVTAEFRWPSICCAFAGGTLDESLFELFLLDLTNTSSSAAALVSYTGPYFRESCARSCCYGNYDGCYCKAPEQNSAYNVKRKLGGKDQSNQEEPKASPAMVRKNVCWSRQSVMGISGIATSTKCAEREQSSDQA